MKITDLEIAGYGVWSGLRIEKFSETLNVLYGPNEAGKTTLLEFIRSMLYGFSPPRQRYLPPVHGGRPGGTIDLASPQGRFCVARFEAAADGSPGEQLTLTAADGTRQGEHFVKVLLSGVDEPVFNNVFAVGLREVQELATLSDTEAAELLYNLTAGLDRVSLVEVLRELAASRNRILDSSGGPCQLAHLFAEREKLRGEIEELGAVNRRYGHLAAEREQIHAEATRLEEEAAGAERQARILNLAIALRERWVQRAALDEQLAGLGPPKTMPEDAIQRLDGINARLKKHDQRLGQLAQLREEAKREFAALAINEPLWRQAARIAAFGEQESWIAQLLSEIGGLKDESHALERELAAEGERLGLGAELAALPSFSTRMFASLRGPAGALRQRRGRLAEAKRQAAAAEESLRLLTEQIHGALEARGRQELATAMDRAGTVVSQLRRRLQIDERLAQLARHQSELEERSRRLVEPQNLPRGVLAGVGGLIALGMVLLLAGLFMSSTAVWIGLAIAMLGAFGMATFMGGKLMRERSNAQQLDGCQKQLGLLELQIQQTTGERDTLDAQLPPSGAAIADRLAAAEKDLASLEEVAPLDARRGALRREAEDAARHAGEAAQELKIARRRWREALAAAGLPETVRPQQVRLLAQHGERIVERQRRLAERREDLGRRQREVDALAGRIVQLSADTGVALTPAGPIEQLRQLVEAVAQQETTVARRDAIRCQARRNRIARTRHEEAAGALKHRRRQLLIEAGVKDEQEFRQRALEAARADVLRRQRDSLAREIEITLASQCSEEAVRQQLEAAQPAPLDVRRDEMGVRFAAAQQQLRETLERRGRLSEQLEVLAADKQLAAKHLDLAVLDKRIEDAIRRWQVLAAACRVLDSIRSTYERQRQPETLQEASGYLDRLTQGRYLRVWTPLGEHVLRVDDAEGRSLPVESLSRGTREQLFLSLRLALASSYARRGATLPLVLDDVLVNFDADRAKAAAAVLNDYAAAGHQLLVLTCHEHILKLFKLLKTPHGTLPSNAGPVGGAVRLESRGEEPPPAAGEAQSKRRRATSRAKRAAAEPKPVEPPPVPVEAEIRPPAKKTPPVTRPRRDARSAFDADFFDPAEDQRAESNGEQSRGDRSDDENDVFHEDDSLWEGDNSDKSFADLDEDIEME